MRPTVDDDRDRYVALQKELKGQKSLFLNSKCKDEMWKAVLNDKNSKAYSIFDK